ncbi:hypothetical protein HYT84_03825 [Candidatus Micrarchaeota archaeon]|nr:hypothetical protein [Candidatus Micrarchaeota archaeon]
MNESADAVLLDFNGTLVRGNPPRPVSSCLPRVLHEVGSTTPLFIVSTASVDTLRFDLIAAGISPRSFRPVLTHEELPTEVLGYRPDIKTSKVIDILHTLGMPVDEIIEVLAGRKRLPNITNFGDEVVDQMLSDRFGFRFVDVTQLKDPGELSRSLQAINTINLRRKDYQGPLWQAAARPVRTAEAGRVVTARPLHSK